MRDYLPGKQVRGNGQLTFTGLSSADSRVFQELLCRVFALQGVEIRLHRVYICTGTPIYLHWRKMTATGNFDELTSTSER